MAGIFGRIVAESRAGGNGARRGGAAGRARPCTDFPLGGTDVSVVALVERLNIDTIIILDRRHFGAIRPRHCESFRLLPE